MSKVTRLFQSRAISQTLPVRHLTMRRQFATSQPASSKDWSAQQYLKFQSDRTRPSHDLLARVPSDAPKRIVDLGCGPGNSTAVVAQRYPDADVSGIDSSPAMIKKAKETLPDITFQVAGLESYEPEGPVDLYFSNAVFQWIPGQDRIPIMTRLMGQLAPGGVLAVQVPDNLSEPSHAVMREAAFAPGTAWEETMKQAAPSRDTVYTETELYDALRPLSSSVDIWRTTYYHIMENHEAIVEWVKSTGLRPFLDPLTPEQEAGFLAAYLEKIKASYTAQKDGKVLLAYPRLFVVAVKA
jgi:trans-aconitate 2-methyltransferase